MIKQKQIRDSLVSKLSRYFGMSPAEAGEEQIYKATVLTVRDILAQKNRAFSERVKAGEQKRVKKIYEITLAMSAVIMALGTILCLVASRGLMELFTENAETIAAGGTALRIISAGFIISSVSVTASGALEGLG